ncbi:hypothetical protein [Tsuneonella suprasediminis]|nr:hypothetical protein [Tsuneonella suprasediminis]
MTPFTLVNWPCRAVGCGNDHSEMALTFDRGRTIRLLVIPALFDEANKLRRQTINVMRRLDLAGVDTFAPDLPGCNESAASLPQQTLAIWRDATADASRHFKATHTLTVRASAILAPDGLPGWAWAPTGGRQALRGMIRARTIAAKEAGRPEKTEDIQTLGRSEGVELAGWRIGATMFRDLETANPADHLIEIPQSDLGGPGLWLRAEPDEDASQAESLAAILSIALELNP